MLISIAIENFKSFNELTTFNMIASNKFRNNKERFCNSDNISMLKFAVIYGANAFGKSNLIIIPKVFAHHFIEENHKFKKYNNPPIISDYYLINGVLLRYNQ